MQDIINTVMNLSFDDACGLISLVCFTLSATRFLGLFASIFFAGIYFGWWL